MTWPLVSSLHVYKHVKLEHPGYGLPPSLLDPYALTNAQNLDSRFITFQGAVEGHEYVPTLGGTEGPV